MTDIHLHAVIDCTDELSIMYTEARTNKPRLGPAVYAVCLLDKLRSSNPYREHYRPIIENPTFVFPERTVTCSLDALLDSADSGECIETRFASGLNAARLAFSNEFKIGTGGFIDCIREKFAAVSASPAGDACVLLGVSSDNEMPLGSLGEPERMHDLIMLFVREKYISAKDGSGVYSTLARWQHRFRRIKAAHRNASEHIRETAFYLSSVEDLVELGTIDTCADSIRLYMKDAVADPSN